MTPKEKAIELHNKILDVTYDDRDIPGEPTWVSTKCALIAVDEILEATKTKYNWGGGSPEKLIHVEEVKYDTYWQEVKQEIEKL